MGRVARTRLDQESIRDFDDVAVMEWVEVHYWYGNDNRRIVGQYEGVRWGGNCWVLLIATHKSIRMIDVIRFRRQGYIDCETGEVDEFIGPNGT